MTSISREQSPDYDAVERAVRKRCTQKVLGDLNAWTPLPAEVEARHQPTVREAIQAAGWAPFHYPRNVDGFAEPWRAHVLWQEHAHQTALYMRDELGCTSKEPQLVAGCGALVLVTWLPEVDDATAQTPAPVQAVQRARDEEHLAAASAMVQNLLLLLTARGFGTYWSSGGTLRAPEMFAYLGIPLRERLLAAVFIEYPETMDRPHQRIPGKLRDRRSEGWIREVSR